MRNKAFILLLIPLCGTLYAQNINPGKSGWGTSASSVTNIVNAAQVWTNADGIIQLSQDTNNLVTINSLNGLKLDGNPNFFSAGWDFYTYTNSFGDRVNFIGFIADGYATTLALDPSAENSPSPPFLFSTTYSNVIAASSPLFSIQNAHTNKFVVAGNGDLIVAGLVTATNGFATTLHANSTNSLITVGSSPFNYTNTAAQTIVLYLDANGATTTANLNGQTIFKSLAAGDHTIILKPGAYTTITFAIATPIMTWTEL